MVSQTLVQSLVQSAIAPSPTVHTSEQIKDEIVEAAEHLQLHLQDQQAETYRTADLQRVITQWLESSLEALVEDAMFHMVEGDRSHAFNRGEFDRIFSRLQPVPTVQPINQLQKAA